MSEDSHKDPSLPLFKLEKSFDKLRIRANHFTSKERDYFLYPRTLRASPTGSAKSTSSFVNIFDEGNTSSVASVTPLENCTPDGSECGSPSRDGDFLPFHLDLGTDNIEFHPTHLNRLRERNKLRRIGTDAKPVYQIEYMSDLHDVLHDWFTNSRLPDLGTMFPYLHGAISSNQVEFLGIAMENDAAKPPVGVRYLMIVNCDEALGQKPAGKYLRSSLSIGDLLVPKQTDRTDVFTSNTPTSEHIEYNDCPPEDNALSPAEYESFNDVRVTDTSSKPINIRNYGQQHRLLLPVSDIILYTTAKCDMAPLYQLAGQVSRSQNDVYHTYVVSSYDPEELTRLSCGVPSSGENHNGPYLSDYLCDCASLAPASSNLDERSIIAREIRGETNIPGSKGLSLSQHLNNWQGNYIIHEQYESWLINQAREVYPNVYTGNSNMASVVTKVHKTPGDGPQFDVIVDCTWDKVRFPTSLDLKCMFREVSHSTASILFPASGSKVSSEIDLGEALSIINTVKLLYFLSKSHKKVLVYCEDGKTYTSLLMLCLEMYVNCVSLSRAVLNFHKLYQRDLWLFPADFELLSYLEPCLLYNSAKEANRRSSEFDQLMVTSLSHQITRHWYNNVYKPYFLTGKTQPRRRYSSVSGLCEIREEDESREDGDEFTPQTDINNDWFSTRNPDCNLPSTILPGRLLLGNCRHASSRYLVENLGLERIISLGEKPGWLPLGAVSASPNTSVCYFGKHKIYIIRNPLREVPRLREVVYIPSITDDGTSSITPLLSTLTELCELQEYRTLVHCQVGVSRSATIVIAMVMKMLGISLIRAYCFVRVRRLNLIIQPNLRFCYELLKYEEELAVKGGGGLLREVDWHILCLEIQRLNNHYVR
ncbi:hypothetical protein BABINDRAFT_163334 [Babjeviella inositovora NRRL Y-12698]|uniref:Uncharacterized protein n=1 Tax=Babjeviella inositovora NRRL Y-12698 TaxID=984486 RepID=A0A1E3QKT5_9ASCO|nr:uncharacterized protein BABINDRAFT_163334 [Babjeviella inositovora NRRL Y-12698]ODQ77607.1 hypothetical protein BABINDRAFT_163334 [Babjeviella inositovora NRRL Y-12698]